MLKAYLNKDKSTAELLRLLRKPYLRNCDIVEILGCSKSAATKVMDEIHLSLKPEERPTSSFVTKSSFLAWQGMTEEDYIRYARIEKELLG